jgi:hypothetical protein
MYTLNVFHLKQRYVYCTVLVVYVHIYISADYTVHLLSAGCHRGGQLQLLACDSCGLPVCSRKCMTSMQHQAGFLPFRPSIYFSCNNPDKSRRRLDLNFKTLRGCVSRGKLESITDGVHAVVQTFYVELRQEVL